MSTERLAALAAVMACVLAVAAAARRRRPDPPTRAGHRVPMQVDRADFISPDVPWLVAAFTSVSCSTCADVAAKVAVLASQEVAVENVEWSAARDRHDRYGIEAVPLVVVADASGIVRAAFVGPVSAQDLWSAVAECREPGSTPGTDGCTGTSRVL